MSRNPILGVMGESVLLLLSDRIKNVTSRGTSELTLDRHHEILDAIRRHQPAKASATMAVDIKAIGARFAAAVKSKEKHKARR